LESCAANARLLAARLPSAGISCSHLHFSGREGHVMAFGESFGAFVGGFEHGQQGNIQMETAYAQNQNTRCEEIRFISKDAGAALIEVVALCGNQSRDGAHLRN